MSRFAIRFQLTCTEYIAHSVKISAARAIACAKGWAQLRASPYRSPYRFTSKAECLHGRVLRVIHAQYIQAAVNISDEGSSEVRICCTLVTWEKC